MKANISPEFNDYLFQSQCQFQSFIVRAQTVEQAAKVFEKQSMPWLYQVEPRSALFVRDEYGRTSMKITFSDLERRFPWQVTFKVLKRNSNGILSYER